jgi:hypothetical protein
MAKSQEGGKETGGGGEREGERCNKPKIRLLIDGRKDVAERPESMFQTLHMQVFHPPRQGRPAEIGLAAITSSPSHPTTGCITLHKTSRREEHLENNQTS